MINWSLFKKECRANYKIFLIFLSVLALYGSMMVAMFDPKLGDSLDAMAKSMPQIFAAFGMTNMSATLLEFLVNYLYNFLFIAFPAVFIIIVSNRLVAQYVERGSMAYLLATPNTRKKIIFTQMKFLSASIFLMVAFVIGLCLILCEAMFPGELAVGKFILVNAGLFALLIFLSGLCFCASCIFNDAKLSYSVGGGLVIAFILIQMIAQVGEKFEFLKYINPLTLFNTDGLIAGDINAILMLLILLVAGWVFYFIGAVAFCKRDLPL